TGRPPFRAATTLDTLAQVLHSEPVPPSRFQPKLPRDLETICLKCLQKEPHKRYGSAADLAEDLRRFRSGEVIRARPAGLWERSVKWVRRNPAATVVTLTLLIGVVVSTVFGVDAVRQADNARTKEGEVRNYATRLGKTLLELEQSEGNLKQANTDL